MKPRFMFLVLIIAFVTFLNPVEQISFADDNLQQSTFASPILVVNTSFLNIRTGPGASYSILATVPGGTELPVLAIYEDEIWYQVATNVGVGWVNIEYLLARGDFSRVPLVEYGSFAPVTSSGVAPSVANLGQGGNMITTGGFTGQVGVGFIGGDLYAAPGGNSAVIAALVPADTGRVFPLISIAYVDNRPFYQVNYAEYGVVWSDQFRIRPLNCGGQTVLSALETVGTIPIGNSDSIEFVRGDEMIVSGPGRDGLIEIVTADGTRGLVPADKVEPATNNTVYFCDGFNPTVPTTVVGSTVTTVNPGQGGGVTTPALSGARLVVNTGNLNIRTGPSASYSILATVPGGTELPVTAIYEDEVWYQVVTSAGLGWVNIEFTLARGDFSRVPLIEYGSFAPVTSSVVAPSVANLGQGGGIVTTGGFTGQVGVGFIGGDLYAAPGGNSAVIAALVPADTGRVFPLISIAYVDNRPFYQVNYAEYGVVWSDQFRIRPLNCGGQTVLSALETVGTIPIGNSDSIEFVRGDEMIVAGPGRDGLVEIVTADGTRGLVPADKVEPATNNTVYFCDGFNPTVPTTVVGSTGVPVNPGQGGGVTTPAVSGARLVVNTGNLNIRTGPGASYSILATVPGGTELPVTAIYEDEVWYQVATSAGLGWVNIEFTLARGDFSRVPLIEYGAITPATAAQTTTATTVTTNTTSAVTAAARVVVNTPNLNIRTGPSASFSIVATVSGGTELAVLGVADDGVWYLVEGSFGRGWLNNEFVIFRGDYSAVPVLNINP